MRLLLAALLLLAAAPPADVWDWSTADLSWLGDDGAEYADSRARCAAVIHAEPPESDRPTAAEAKALKGCDSEALYYGIGRPADPVLARKCAFVETEGGEFGGRNMLMTVYANGKGAARNIDVATHLACGIEMAASMEMKWRIEHLAKLKPGEEFGLCDDATSGYLGGWCAQHDARFADNERDREMLAIARAGGFANAADWRALNAALTRYADAHGNDETDMSGTLRVAMAIAGEQEVRDHFLIVMTMLSDGKLPAASAAQLAATDAQLNRQWKALMSDLSGETYGTVTAAGMRNGGRSWIAYRDALLAFAKAHYPAASQTGLARLLTQQRIHEISDE